MPRTEAVYVVQKREPTDDDGCERWKDVATVTVPPKTKRKTVIEKAVFVADDAVELTNPVLLRVIPAEHAEPIKVEMEQPPPRLRIG